MRLNRKFHITENVQRSRQVVVIPTIFLGSQRKWLHAVFSSTACKCRVLSPAQGRGTYLPQLFLHLSIHSIGAHFLPGLYSSIQGFCWDFFLIKVQKDSVVWATGPAEANEVLTRHLGVVVAIPRKETRQRAVFTSCLWHTQTWLSREHMKMKYDCLIFDVKGYSRVRSGSSFVPSIGPGSILVTVKDSPLRKGHFKF